MLSLFSKWFTVCKCKNFLTVWKFQAFSVTWIFREINFLEFWSAKLAILIHLEALNFDFHAFLHFLNAENDQINKILRPKNGKNGSF